MQVGSVRKNKIFAVTFLVMLISTTLVSNYKVIKYYVNDEVINNEWNASTDSKFETDLIANFWGKVNYVNFNGLIRNFLGQHEMNGVMKLNNGHLIAFSDYVDDDTLINYAESVNTFSEYLNSKEDNFVYIVLPCAIDRYNNQLPIGVDDYANDNLDRMKLLLEERKVDVLDIREKMHESEMEVYDIFFKTDHHWTPIGGHIAFTYIMNYLHDNYGIEPDYKIMDLNNYEITTYKKWHLGSRGQRVGKYYAGIDDFDLIIPKFDSYFENIESKEYGTYEELMINKSALVNQNYESRYTYDNVYSSLRNWHNPNASVKKSILVVSDSMNRVVCPYFAMTFENVYYAYDITVNNLTKEIYDEYNPDIVLCMYCNGAFSDSSYEFFTNKGEND